MTSAAEISTPNLRAELKSNRHLMSTTPGELHRVVEVREGCAGLPESMIEPRTPPRRLAADVDRRDVRLHGITSSKVK